LPHSSDGDSTDLLAVYQDLNALDISPTRDLSSGNGLYVAGHLVFLADADLSRLTTMDSRLVAIKVVG
jgi:hypothetical protein